MFFTYASSPSGEISFGGWDSGYDSQRGHDPRSVYHPRTFSPWVFYHRFSVSNLVNMVARGKQDSSLAKAYLEIIDRALPGQVTYTRFSGPLTTVPDGTLVCCCFVYPVGPEGEPARTY